MCGIAGIYDLNNFPTKNELEPMVDIMYHRGPDSKGLMKKGPIAMGMRRLSIIDLSENGNQPISNEDESITVICNGEIYNYVELKEDLISHGYNFKSESDTEVLIYLYDLYGPKMLPLLNGMFAFSIWDNKKKSLFISRDRIGIKPLYHTNINNRFMFASELKSILMNTNAKRLINKNAIADYLQMGYIPNTSTPYKGINKLLPGHYIICDANGIQIKQWWDISKLPMEEKKEIYGNNYLADQFDKSIDLRMRSDVPVAGFLSGGLDSSLIVSTAAKLSNINFSTYNVKFEDSVFDESPFARTVAKHSGTKHHQINASIDDVIKYLPLIIWHIDEPIADSAIVPSFLVSMRASKDVKVCLSGLGGDELFGGYSRYIDKPMGKYRKFLSKVPWLAYLITKVLSLFNISYARKIKPLTSKTERWRNYLLHIQLFEKNELKKLGFEKFGKCESLIKDLWEKYPGNDSVGRRQFIDQHTYLPDQILALTDKLSMATSLEVRVPFLDHNMVISSTRIPESQKQNKNEFKILLKKVLGNRVPKKILNRRKWGFASPMQNWVDSVEFKKIIKKLPAALITILNKKEVERLIKNTDEPRYHNIIWSLLVLAIWLKVKDYTIQPDINIFDLLEIEK